jgi:mRNA interferase RelE/StbE
MRKVYKIKIVKPAEKQLDKLEDDLFRRIDSAILQLASNPRPGGHKKLKGQKNILRIRIGDYRVLYQVDDASKQITILGVLHRREAYR